MSGCCRATIATEAVTKGTTRPLRELFSQGEPTTAGGDQRRQGSIVSVRRVPRRLSAARYRLSPTAIPSPSTDQKPDQCLGLLPQGGSLTPGAAPGWPSISTIQLNLQRVDRLARGCWPGSGQGRQAGVIRSMDARSSCTSSPMANATAPWPCSRVAPEPAPERGGQQNREAAADHPCAPTVETADQGIHWCSPMPRALLQDHRKLPAAPSGFEAQPPISNLAMAGASGWQCSVTSHPVRAVSLVFPRRLPREAPRRVPPPGRWRSGTTRTARAIGAGAATDASAASSGLQSQPTRPAITAATMG